MHLQNERVVLIGGSAGIGLATAHAASAAGAQVVIAGRSADRLAGAKAALGQAVETAVLDGTKEAEVAAFFARLGRFHHLAMFLPSAASQAITTRLGPFLQSEAATYEGVMLSKFWGQFYCARHGAGQIEASGSITFMSATTPRKAIPGYGASACANGAVEALANTLAVELAPVRVNAIAPGFVATELTRALPPERLAQWNRLTERQPVKRMATPEEIAQGILFLMTNRFVTGEVLTVDGGYKYT